MVSMVAPEIITELCPSTNLTVPPVPAKNVPLLVQLPPTLIFPAPSVNIPFIRTSFEIVRVALLMFTDAPGPMVRPLE